MVMLRDLFKAFELLHNCWLSADNVQSFAGNYLAAFDVDGPLWYGEVKGLALSGTLLVHQQRWGTNTNIVIHSLKFVAPPRTASWYDGAHILEVRSPADGQYAEWRCGATRNVRHIDSADLGRPQPDLGFSERTGSLPVESRLHDRGAQLKEQQWPDSSLTT